MERLHPDRLDREQIAGDYRGSLLTIDSQRVFAIHEWFLRSVLEALDRQARG